MLITRGGAPAGGRWPPLEKKIRGPSAPLEFFKGGGALLALESTNFQKMSPAEGHYTLL